MFHKNLFVFPCLFFLLAILWTLHVINLKFLKTQHFFQGAQDNETGDLQPSMFVLLLDNAENICSGRQPWYEVMWNIKASWSSNLGWAEGTSHTEYKTMALILDSAKLAVLV